MTKPYDHDTLSRQLDDICADLLATHGIKTCKRDLVWAIKLVMKDHGAVPAEIGVGGTVDWMRDYPEEVRGYLVRRSETGSFE